MNGVWFDVVQTGFFIIDKKIIRPQNFKLLKKSANLQHSLIISLLLVADGWQMWQILGDLSIVWSEGDYIMVF